MGRRRLRALGFGVGFAQMLTLLGLAVVAITHAVMNLGLAIGPPLADTSAGGGGCKRRSRCGGLRGRTRGRRHRVAAGVRETARLSA